MNNVRITMENPDARPLLICDDVSRLRINGMGSDPAVTAEHLISFTNVRDAVVKGTIPPVGTKTWIRVIGEKSANILLMPDDLGDAKKSLHSGDEVPSDAVHLRTE
jgi:hypothetical protein